MEYFIIKNKKTGKTYKVSAFNSYIIDQSIDIPADFFSFSVSNFNAKVSSKITAGDEVFFYVNDELVLNGLIDDIDIIGDVNSNSVEVVGRDKTLLLLDNDAIPKTYYNMNIENYLNNQITQYGIDKFEVSDKEPFDKIVISAGQSEWGIIEELCKRKGLYPRYDIDVLKCTPLRFDTDMDYHFSNDYDGTIKFKNYRIRISSDIKSEILVYSGNYKRGTDYNSSKNIKGSAKDENLTIIKRGIMNEDELENKVEADNIAKEELKRANSKAFSIEFETHTKIPININKIAKVTIKNLNLECYMLINKVQYIKNQSAGSITKVTLQLIEGVSVEWDNHSIPTIPR